MWEPADSLDCDEAIADYRRRCKEYGTWRSARTDESDILGIMAYNGSCCGVMLYVCVCVFDVVCAFDVCVG